jgi:hypothetical protein
MREGMHLQVTEKPQPSGIAFLLDTRCSLFHGIPKK